MRVLAWGELRRFGMVSSSVIVTGEFVGSCDLHELKRGPRGDRGARVEAVLDGLPAALARLHADGIFARTLRGKNVLFHSSGRVFYALERVGAGSQAGSSAASSSAPSPPTR